MFYSSSSSSSSSSSPCLQKYHESLFAKPCTHVFTDDFSLVTNSFSLHLVSLESPVIPLDNDVPFVMIMQFGAVQHT